ncbi:MAG: alpha/beta hydrolase [Pseudomonadota bacterium]
MPMIDTRDGTRLHFKSWGEGRPVVLIHGWPLSGDSWDPISHALAEAGFRAIAYDRRGFGRSDQPSGGYDYDTFADDLAAVIDQACGGREAALVGFSMGGGEIARYMSRHRGHGVNRIALISSVVPFMSRTDDNPQGVPASVFAKMTEDITTDRAHFLNGFFRDFYGVGWMDRPVSDEVLRHSWTMAMMAGLRPTLLAAKAFATTDFRADLQHITVPTLLVHGTADQTVPIDATARAVARAVPHAQLVEYDGDAHGVFATRTQRLTEDLIAFFDDRALEDRQDVLDAVTAQSLVAPPI